MLSSVCVSSNDIAFFDPIKRDAEYENGCYIEMLNEDKQGGWHKLHCMETYDEVLEIYTKAKNKQRFLEKKLEELRLIDYDK